MRLEVIEHLDDYFDPADYPAEVLVDKVVLVEVNGAFLVIIHHKTAIDDGNQPFDYAAFDSLQEAHDLLDTLGYDILR